MQFAPTAMSLLPMLVASLWVNAVQAQELARIRNDYLDNPLQEYQPDDPWMRSRIWQRQTGHFGRFYNCDCEERKRFSPYICWKHGDLPGTGESLRNCLDRTICRVKQRIHDGTCGCGSSDCTRCDSTTHNAFAAPAPHSDCSCSNGGAKINTHDAATEAARDASTRNASTRNVATSGAARK